ncbi:hypothetical protein D7030_11380 [Flavobacteriaceae bacterium AU392]|nr:hypothetical protein D1817_13290 [Flavobacteriaceae bacterium]RKM82759.1 hypothetical protein D7030_11380 [Flavobacteriaceae bacterium AU392]
MITIFRKIRQQFLSKNKFRNYLLYAIGEIALVTIGILLALQANNWNEKRAQKIELNNALKDISNDMIIDTTSASRIIAFYEDNQKYSQKIINKELSLDNYKECLQCMGLITVYQPFTIQTRGFERLKTISQKQSTQNDSLIADITEIYSQLIPLINKSNERMENEILSNFNDFKQFPWFVDLFQGKFNQEMIEYFVLSEDYRKRVAAHSVLAAGNHLNLTKTYNINAKQILIRIDEHLKKVEK